MSKKEKVKIHPGAETFGMLGSFLGAGICFFFAKQVEGLWPGILIGFGLMWLFVGLHSFFNLLYHFNIVKDQSHCAGIAVMIAIITFQVLGYYMFFSKMEFIKNSEKVEATVVHVDYDVKYKESRDDEGRTTRTKEDNCSTEVIYAVDGKTYRKDLGSSSCKYKEGDLVKVRYDKNHPENMKHFSLLSALIGLASGVILTIITIGYFIVGFRNQMAKKKGKDIKKTAKKKRVNKK